MAQTPYDPATDMHLMEGANSLYSVLVTEFGYAGAKSWSAMKSFIIANVNIAFLDPRVRPQLITSINRSNQLRGFPQDLAPTICGKYIEYNANSPGAVEYPTSGFDTYGIEQNDAIGMPYTHLVDIGANKGTVEVVMLAGNIPDKFEIWYAGELQIDSGWMGNSVNQTKLNNRLVELGFSSMTPATVVLGEGTLTTSFLKRNAAPNLVELRIYAPLYQIAGSVNNIGDADTGWYIKVNCPDSQYQVITMDLEVYNNSGSTKTLKALTVNTNANAFDNQTPVSSFISISNTVTSALSNSILEVYDFYGPLVSGSTITMKFVFSGDTTGNTFTWTNQGTTYPITAVPVSITMTYSGVTFDTAVNVVFQFFAAPSSTYTGTIAGKLNIT